jgi:hypothetical protein
VGDHEILKQMKKGTRILLSILTAFIGWIFIAVSFAIRLNALVTTLLLILGLIMFIGGGVIILATRVKEK